MLTYRDNIENYYKQPWRSKEVLDVIHLTDGTLSEIADQLHDIKRTALYKRFHSMTDLIFPDDALVIITDPELSDQDIQDLLKEIEWVVPLVLINNVRDKHGIPAKSKRSRVQEIQKNNPDAKPGEIVVLYNDWRIEKGLEPQSYHSIVRFLYE